VKNTILFSDVHLKPAGEATASREGFLSFLRGINPAHTDRLVCLGDLFDFWLEYRHAMFSGYFDVLRVFADLNQAGVALHLVCGNHDFWAGESLQRLTGFIVHHEPVRLPFGGKEALLLHGDGLNPKDYGYRLFKRIARNPLAVSLFRRVHPDAAMAIARFMSRGSRTITQVDKPAAGPEARYVREHAHHLLRGNAADIVICGHAHAPVVERITTDKGEGLYVNPGDWPNHRSYVVFENDTFTLRHFE